MILARASWHWCDISIVGFAGLIVYPDKVLDWVADYSEWDFGWRSVAVLEATAIVLIFLTFELLPPIYPRLQWWQPFFYVGFLGILRAVLWLAGEFFGFNDR